MTERKQSGPPVLAVDVDGVISLYGFDEPLEQTPCEFHLIDGMPHCISLATGDRLRRLGGSYELVWATGWEERANDHLTALLGLPQLPVVTFGGAARFGTAHWKVDPLARYAEGRALAWIDDSLDASCYEWAERRSEPTLLVPCESDHGLEEAHVEVLLAWAENGFVPP